MIFVDGQRIEPTAFPDGTSSLRFQSGFGTDLASFMFAYKPEHNIRWLYDNDAECMQLMYIVKHLKSTGECRIVLEMPYIPNARMDRVKNTDEVFTLKWFADFINSMGFASVKVLDPHSNVSPALFDRVEMMDVKRYIDRAIHCAKGDKQDLLLCYPDEGAAKRYSDMLGMEYVFCIKHRDWRTGKIENTELTSPEKVKGRDVLIVDDICSRGGTFTYTAKVLKEADAGNITLYVTHCENAIHNGSVLTDGLISHVFTTDSILRISHEKITVMSTDVLNFAKGISKELKDRREAYQRVKPKRSTRKAMILNVLTSGDPGGMTADEIGDQLVAEGIITTNSPNFTRPRLTELKAEGLVEVVGRRPGRSGCNTAVWKVKR